MRALLAIALVVVSALAAAPALAQDDDSDFDFDEEAGATVIKGTEHLPDFTVVIDRENLTKAYDLRLEESFLPKIMEALDKPPF